MGGIMMAANMGGGKLTVSLSPANQSASGTGSPHVGNMTALPANGSGAYTYAWTVVQPDPTYALTINSPAAATTDFDFSGTDDGYIAKAKVRCTVTDTGTGQTAFAEGYVTYVDRNVFAGGGGGGIGVIP
jgi:hypothetical protein